MGQISEQISEKVLETLFQIWRLFSGNFVQQKSGANQEDVNGVKLTVKKWRIFGADFSRFTQSFSRFIRDINGEKKTSRY